MTEIIGIIAATFTTISFVPQVVKVLKTNDTKSISKAMYLCFSLGVCLWLVYGFLINSFAVVAANIITLPMALIILWKKLREK